jgi:DNA-binding transcriptional MerR regulator
MRPHYDPDRGRYESEHWERAGMWAKRRFCSRFRVYPQNQKRNAEIRRLGRLGFPIDRIAARLGVTRGVVVGVISRAIHQATRDAAIARRKAMREAGKRKRRGVGQAPSIGTQRDVGH